MKTINIRGKDYTPVSDRVMEFHKIYPNGDINTTITYEGNYVRCKAVVIPDFKNLDRQFTGHAEEDRSQGMINKTNATENAETGAIGRALGFLGIGIIGGIASADEMIAAINKTEVEDVANQIQKDFAKPKMPIAAAAAPERNPLMDDAPFPDAPPVEYVPGVSTEGELPLIDKVCSQCSKKFRTRKPHYVSCYECSLKKK